MKFVVLKSQGEISKELYIWFRSKALRHVAHSEFDEQFASMWFLYTVVPKEITEMGTRNKSSWLSFIKTY